MNIARREFAAALAMAAANPLRVWAQAKMDFPFTLGVAAGEPLPTGIVLWTRLAPKPLEPEFLPAVNVPVRWEVAADEGFRQVVRKGSAMATPGLAHSVHVEVNGLAAGREYWYRFTAAGHQSTVGRFRTAPAPGSMPAQYRLAFASCQQWTQGLWTAYQHLAEEDVELVIHLGDYIYEQGYRGQVRQDGHEETFTLKDYRNRYALYKTDPLLQRAHARFAWMTTWDDHEVSNNYANAVQEKGQPMDAFLKRRADAYQAYYEHMPLRTATIPRGPAMDLYRRADFGGLMRLHMLDTRQYRTDQPCGDGLKKACADLQDGAQTLLGAAQEKWLAEGIAGSKAVWDLLGQQIFVSIQDFDAGADEVYNMDSWSGYPLARKRLVETLAAQPQRNPVIITGDVHSSWAAQLHTGGQDTSTPCVAPEFVCTSISSGGDGVAMTPRTEAMMPVNPQIKFFHGKRGYVRCEVTKDTWRTDYRSVDYVTKPGAPVSTVGSFVVAAGKRVIEKA